MCAQCAASAVTAVGAASGIRAWLAPRLAPRAKKLLGGVLAVAAVLAAGLAA